MGRLRSTQTKKVVLKNIHPKEDKIMKIKLSNFKKNNTPKILQKLGDALLLVGGVGAALVLAPISTPILVTIGAWAAFAGVVGKVLTKFSGEDKTVYEP